MEQKGQRSAAFRLKQRTGDGEVKATRSRDSHGGREDLDRCFEVIRSDNEGLPKLLILMVQCRSHN